MYVNPLLHQSLSCTCNQEIFKLAEQASINEAWTYGNMSNILFEITFANYVPSTLIPACLATTTSGAVLIPTASAPHSLRYLHSEGVS